MLSTFDMCGQVPHRQGRLVGRVSGRVDRGLLASAIDIGHFTDVIHVARTFGPTAAEIASDNIAAFGLAILS